MGNQAVHGTTAGEVSASQRVGATVVHSSHRVGSGTATGCGSTTTVGSRTPRTGMGETGVLRLIAAVGLSTCLLMKRPPMSRPLSPRASASGHGEAVGVAAVAVATSGAQAGSGMGAGAHSKGGSAAIAWIQVTTSAVTGWTVSAALS